MCLCFQKDNLMCLIQFKLILKLRGLKMCLYKHELTTIKALIYDNRKSGCRIYMMMLFILTERLR